MIYEPPKFDYDKAVQTQEKIDRGAIFHCGHGSFFWEKSKIAVIGDVIACEVCCRYFVKLEDLPWIRRRHKSQEHAHFGIDYEIPPRQFHTQFEHFCPVPVRVTS